MDLFTGSGLGYVDKSFRKNNIHYRLWRLQAYLLTVTTDILRFLAGSRACPVTGLRRALFFLKSVFTGNFDGICRTSWAYSHIRNTLHILSQRQRRMQTGSMNILTTGTLNLPTVLRLIVRILIIDVSVQRSADVATSQLCLCRSWYPDEANQRAVASVGQNELL